MRNEKGFTLIELLVVVAIIGILAAIAIPQFAEYRRRGFDSRAVSDLRNAATAEEASFVDNSKYASCTSTTDCAGKLPGFKGSPGVVLSMTDVASDGTNPEYFTGTSSHPSGTSNKTFSWNSNLGGLQAAAAAH